MDRPLYVSYPHPNTRTPKEWRAAGTTARAWAREHGAATVLRADGSGTIFYTDGGKVRQMTRRDMRPAPQPRPTSR